ncbi:hypothetical protein IW261DRAFT_357489 [Armillaria novae-zelandiae]|uniref:F-box domain-containing protein n=1 Tax=Armillaria novae-zelandiae TaxID=153914 RepID=A0AA39PQA9_9AGAR|nr:hypothetical protein IW261DRAFT_357489 [Armillaria novae-zelandiae]
MDLAISTRPFADFPQEIVDAIIDTLCDDTSSLTTCSLVCRRFLPRAQVHLFSTVALAHQHQCVTFYSLIQSSPHLLLNMRTLKLWRGFSTPNRNAWDITYEPLLQPIIRAASNLENLYLSSILCPIPNDINSPLSSIFSCSLTSLELHSVRFADFKHLCAFARAWPTLKSFTCSGLMYTHTVPCEHTHTPGPSVECLDIDGAYGRTDILDSVISSGVCPVSVGMLRSLVFPIHDKQDIDRLQALTKLCADTLQSLHIIHIKSSLPFRLPSELTYQRLKVGSLRRLVVEVYDKSEGSDSGLLDWWINSIGAAEILEDITFKYFIEGGAVLTEMAKPLWRKMDSTLSRLTALRWFALNIVCWGYTVPDRNSSGSLESGDKLEKPRRALNESFRLLKARGVITTITAEIDDYL